jgi:hypothetical protein
MLWAPRRRTIVAPAMLCQPFRHSGCDWCCCMQGNCAGAPPSAASLGLSGAPLLPLLPYQCLLIADVQLLRTSEDSQLWLDGLYVRYLGGHFNTFISNESYLWMTAVTLQGDSDGVQECSACGLRTYGLGGVYAEGALIVCHNSGRSSMNSHRSTTAPAPPHHVCAIHARPAERALPCLARPAPIFCAGL